MATVLSQPRPQDPTLRRWSKAEYYETADRGWFRNQRAELIEGEIVVLSPREFEHGQVVDRAAEILRRVFGSDFWVRMQLPLNLGPSSEPEPDVSVVPGRREDHHEHPTQVALLVEISDTTLAYDRGEKASLYARAGVRDYWVIDLVHRQLHVFRDPAPDATQPFGLGYRTIVSLRGSEVVLPLAAPAARIAVGDLIARTG